MHPQKEKLERESPKSVTTSMHVGGQLACEGSRSHAVDVTGDQAKARVGDIVAGIDQYLSQPPVAPDQTCMADNI